VGGTTEREFMDKLAKIKEKSIKTAKEIKSDFTKIEEIKAEALRKTEEMRRISEHEAETVEEEMAKAKDLAPESKRRLYEEIKNVKAGIVDKYSELKARISKAIMPE
jgi:O6-methylguanine-DNA--protein-cysteine methyltransferase